MIRKTAISALVALACVTAGAQTTQRFTANKASEYALVYSLPLTVVDITIETEHKIVEPGEFYNYANRHLGISNAVKKPGETVSIKSITMVPRGVANPDNRWQAQFKSGSQTSMLLTEAGVPLAINLDEVSEQQMPELPVAVAAKPTPLETDAARHAMTLEMTRSNSISKKAELAAQRIFELREQRNELISGNADNMPPDGGALKVALQGLDDQEAALTAMFAGTTKTFTEVTTVTFTPESEDVNRRVLTRISATEGVVASNDLSGAPLYLSMKIIAKGELPKNEKGEVKKFPKGGVAYMIPGSAEITLEFNGKKIASTTVDLAQLGSTFGIDPGLFTDKKSPSFIEFSPVTGAIVRLDAVRQ